MNHIEAMKQALEALESCTPGDYSTGHVINPSYDEQAVEQAITALRRALEQQPAEEPVAWSDEQLKMLNFLDGAGDFDSVWFGERHPTELGAFWWRKHLRRLFYTRPQPAAQWVGLTVEEIEHEWDEFMSGKSDGYVPTFVRAIEAKLREKNTGETK